MNSLVFKSKLGGSTLQRSQRWTWRPGLSQLCGCQSCPASLSVLSPHRRSFQLQLQQVFADSKQTTYELEAGGAHHLQFTWFPTRSFLQSRQEVAALPPARLLPQGFFLPPSPRSSPGSSHHQLTCCESQAYTQGDRSLRFTAFFSSPPGQPR